jgi:D-serine deaminase-like pyridoxal phosphate-dependent protein
MSKSFTHAGVSKLDGEFKVRFANDALRTKVLIKNGHTDIDIIELKHAMTKEDAVAYLMEIDFATRDGVTNEAVQAALAAEIDKRSEVPAKEPKAKAEKAPKAAKAKAKPTMKAIEAKVAAKKAAAPKSTVSKAEVIAQLADMEDAPF